MAGERLSEKDLHCIARNFQSERIGENVQCLYCKYAISCAEEFKATGKYPADETLERLEENTGVNIRIYDERKVQKELLKGSWIEKYPRLFESLSKCSLEEQCSILQSPDIYSYMK